MFLNEATLLDNIKNRYYKDKIYVSDSYFILNFKILLGAPQLHCNISLSLTLTLI